MPNVGPLEIIVVLGIVLLVFGPKRLPQAGRALGQSMREFKDSLGGGRKGSELEGGSNAQTVSTDSSPAGSAQQAAVPVPPAADEPAGGQPAEASQSAGDAGEPPAAS